MTADSILTPAPGGAAAGEAPPKKRKLSLSVILLLIAGGLLALATVRAFTGANDITSSGATRAALQAAVPIGLAGLAGLWSERAGVVNIGLEGMMIFGTWFGAFGAFHWGWGVGLVAAMVGGALGGLLHALATVTFGVDHIVSGVAITILALGSTRYLSSLTFANEEGGGVNQSPSVPQPWRWSVPGAEWATKGLEAKHWWLVSDLAGIIRGVFTNFSIATVIAIALVPLSFWILWRTSFGLRLRSVGESPQAAESLGINVYLYKYYGVVASGAIAGLGGAFLSMVAANIYREGQTNGRGYIGLAAMIFGNWRPGGLAAGSLLFGYPDALQLRGGATSIHALLLLVSALLLAVAAWQLYRNKRVVGGLALMIAVLGFVAFFATDEVPVPFVQFTPHLTTLVVLALAAQRLRPPAADGVPYRRGG
jgi:general nucleoside transport system permease protein